ncbi:serine hydrolase domain-containing protein [Brevundimonas sp.]|uniref:serine hydrolase domain-containing protein n=1 Tax=Brevundimonas sp. TaxID=1871086 RepID=UPI00286A3913|nr:serine hydrolase domain-containing protein [Brevundimonas sp.]
MDRRRLIGTGASAYGLALTAMFGSPAQGRQGEQGFIPEGLARLDAHFAGEVSAGRRAGYVICLGRHGREAHRSAIGLADVASSRPMTPTTLFRIASLTKLVTSVAVMQLVEEGRLLIDDPVGRYLPAVGAMQVAVSPEAPDDRRHPARPMTVRHLMLHMSGLGYRSDGATALGRRYQGLDLFHGNGTLAETIDRLAEQPLYADPGERVIYSFSTDVLGRLVEVASQEPLAARLKRTIFDPLGMSDTGFHLKASRRQDLATVYEPGPGDSLVSSGVEVFGDPFNPDRWPSGGAGLISTGPDYLRFLMAMERRGTLDGARILSTGSVDLMLRNHLPAAVMARLGGTPLAGLGFGLGSAVVVDAAQAAAHYRDGDAFWSGHFDTQYFISPSTGVASMIMTQLRETPGATPGRTAADLRALTYGALA